MCVCVCVCVCVCARARARVCVRVRLCLTHTCELQGVLDYGYVAAGKTGGNAKNDPMGRRVFFGWNMPWSRQGADGNEGLCLSLARALTLCLTLLALTICLCLFGSVS